MLPPEKEWFSKLDDLERRLAKWVEDTDSGKISLEEARAKQKEFNAELKELRAQLKQ